MIAPNFFNVWAKLITIQSIEILPVSASYISELNLGACSEILVDVIAGGKILVEQTAYEFIRCSHVRAMVHRLINLMSELS